MALKNMIKLKDRVTFGRSGEKKVAGRVVKLNPKTAHIKCSNGDVMSVSYGFIQKPTTKATKARIASRKTKRKPAKTKRNPYGSFAMTKRKAPAKRKPATGGAYDAWVQKQNVTQLRQLEKAYKSILTSPSGMTLKNEARRKSAIVKKELRRRGK